MLIHQVCFTAAFSAAAHSFAADLIKVVAKIESDIEKGEDRSSSFYGFIILLLSNKSPDRCKVAEYLSLFPWYSFDQIDQDLSLND